MVSGNVGLGVVAWPFWATPLECHGAADEASSIASLDHDPLIVLLEPSLVPHRHRRKAI